MSYAHPIWLEGRRKYWTRPDAYRFAPPGSPEAKMPGWLDPWMTRVRAKEAAEDAARARAAAEEDEFERELLHLRWEVKKLKLEHELWCFEQKYSPNQPRVPAGNPDGGQWTSGNGFDAGNSAVGPSNEAPGVTQTARLAQLSSEPTTATDANVSNFNPDKSGWHDFTAGPNLTCRPELRCSREEIADQLARFSVPGRDPSSPVADGDISPVYDPRNGLPGGWVKTMVEDDGLTIINQTTPLHALYDGAVVRNARQADDGAWYVTTRGFGNNIVPGMNILNQEQGPLIFSVLDQRMRENVERHHAKGFSTLANLRVDGGSRNGTRPLLAGPQHVR